MGVRDRNVDPNSQFARMPVQLDFAAGASLAAVKMAGWRAPFPVKIISAHVYAAQLTDADDSVRIDLHKNAASVLTATVDPVAADTTTALTLSGSPVLDTGDVLKAVITTGVGDAFTGGITVVVRPYLGTVERQALRNGGTSITV